MFLIPSRDHTLKGVLVNLVSVLWCVLVYLVRIVVVDVASGEVSSCGIHGGAASIRLVHCGSYCGSEASGCNRGEEFVVFVFCCYRY